MHCTKEMSDIEKAGWSVGGWLTVGDWRCGGIRWEGDRRGGGREPKDSVKRSTLSGFVCLFAGDGTLRSGVPPMENGLNGLDPGETACAYALA